MIENRKNLVTKVVHEMMKEFTKFGCFPEFSNVIIPIVFSPKMSSVRCLSLPKLDGIVFSSRLLSV